MIIGLTPEERAVLQAVRDTGGDVRTAKAGVVMRLVARQLLCAGDGDPWAVTRAALWALQGRKVACMGAPPQRAAMVRRLPRVAGGGGVHAAQRPLQGVPPTDVDRKDTRPVKVDLIEKLVAHLRSVETFNRHELARSMGEVSNSARFGEALTAARDALVRDDGIDFRSTGRGGDFTRATPAQTMARSRRHVAAGLRKITRGNERAAMLATADNTEPHVQQAAQRQTEKTGLMQAHLSAIARARDLKRFRP